MRTARPRLDLSGAWELAFDDEDRGEAERWFDPESPGHAAAPWGATRVPGVFPAPGGALRHPGGDHAIGWYRRDFELPEAFSGRRLALVFDAAERVARVHLNGHDLGGHAGGWAPFRLDATDSIRPGRNRLVVRVEHRERVTRGFVQLAGANYAGLWQGVRLEATEDLYLEEASVRPELRTSYAVFDARVRNAGETDSRFAIAAEVAGAGERTVHLWVPRRSSVPVRLPVEIPSPIPWEPGRPHLYEGTVQLSREGREVDRATIRFGMREVRAEANRLLLNGRPLELRGALHWGWYPDRIAPDPEEAAIRAEFAALRSLGFNAVKPCLVVFPEAFYDIADEEGMLVWQEHPNWQVRVHDGNRAAIAAEYREMARRLRDHPSVVLCTLACEYDKRLYDEALLADAFRATKEMAPAWLVCDNSGGWSGPPPRPLGPSRFADFRSAHPYPGRLRGFEPRAVVRSRERPFLLGETADGDTWKNLPAIVERNGGEPPWWFRPHQREALERFSREEFARFASLSLRQTLVYRKHLLESFRALPDLSGFVVTHLHDVADLGSGLLDESRAPKWSAEEFAPFNGEVVLLAEFPDGRRSFWSGSTVEVRILGRNATAARLPAGRLRRTGAGEGEIETPPVDAGGVRPLATVRLPAGGDRARRDAVECEWTAGERRIANRWNLWVFRRDALLRSSDAAVVLDDAPRRLAGLERLYPFVRRFEPGAPRVPEGTYLVVASVPSNATREFVAAGGKVLLLGTESLPLRRVPFRRESVTWISDHPALEGFPHEGFPDLQFLRLEPGFAIDLEGERDVRAIVERFDCRELRRDAYVVEAALGRGAILAASFDFGGLDEEEPATCSLADALLRYALSPALRPRGALTAIGAKAWLDADLYADDACGRLFRRLPFVRRWWIAGPFDDARATWTARYPPEEAPFDPGARFPDGGGGMVGWTRFESASPFVDLAKLWPAADKVAAYAYAEFEAEADFEADLWIGSDDGERVWWNGKLVLDRSDHREPHPDQDRARVAVLRGLNRALLRICDANHRLGFYFRAAVPDGAPPLRSAPPGTRGNHRGTSRRYAS